MKSKLYQLACIPDAAVFLHRVKARCFLDYL